MVMMIMMGYPPREMRFLPFEINIVSDQSCASSWERFCIAFGGIIFNLLVWRIVSIDVIKAKVCKEFIVIRMFAKVGFTLTIRRIQTFALTML